ncbi:MAG: alpha/beta fold hydrolase [Oscillospiraceae bacterium]|nr:alpha/beta fold hydrolase [Oscillospiraceae bacterium]
MSMLKKNVLYKSASGKDTVHGYVYTQEGVQPKAILQISHGMCEYIGRYEDFAEFLTESGYVVCGNDHLGHGETSSDGGEDGFFAEKGGANFVLQDLHQMTKEVKALYPGLPLFLMGHSMGSFFARKYAVTYPQELTGGLIISGTGGPNPLAGVGIRLASLIKKIKGSHYHSKMINNMAFGAYCKRFENPLTEYDWVSSDKKTIETYTADPKCMFTFTVSAFYDMLITNASVNRESWASGLDVDVPIYIFSGGMDPVGDYGEGVKKVYNYVKNAGVKDVSYKLYDKGRHEMLNEVNRKDVYSDVLNWLNAHLQEAVKG